jgi:hypothetical protein
MDDSSVHEVKDGSTATDVSISSINPTDSVAPNGLTNVTPLHKRKKVTDVTKNKNTRKKRNHSSISANIEETQRLWQMRWCYFWVGIIFCILWMVAMIGMSLFVFYITRNFLSLLISVASTPAIEFMRRFANYLLPMDEKRFLLAQKNIEMKAKKSTNVEQIYKSLKS